MHGPDAEPWEVYTVLADAPVMRPADEAGCCTPAAETVSVGAKPTACC